MKRLVVLILVCLPLLALPALYGQHREGCSTAVFSAEAAGGAPMLWKNRDTDVLSNKVIFVAEKPYSYLALVNHHDTSGRWAYAGLNETGFGIFNSVAYNLPEPGGEMKDLEGLIMADALRTCRTVEDFEAYLRRNLGENLGSWANFGVMDGNGRAWLFEVHNHGYEKFDAAAAAEKYLVNTNFSRSGAPGKGAGYLRFERASALLAAAGRPVTHRYVLDVVARDIASPLLSVPGPNELRGMSQNTPVWAFTDHSIDRASTAAAVVMQGRRPGVPATLWVVLGEPVCSIALPFWVEAGTTPAAVREGEDAPLWREAARIVRLARPFGEKDRGLYLQLTRLLNRENSGFLPRLQRTQQEIYTAVERFLAVPHSPDELAAFQERMAALALETLKAVH